MATVHCFFCFLNLPESFKVRKLLFVYFQAFVTALPFLFVCQKTCKQAPPGRSWCVPGFSSSQESFPPRVPSAAPTPTPRPASSHPGHLSAGLRLVRRAASPFRDCCWAFKVIRERSRDCFYQPIKCLADRSPNIPGPMEGTAQDAWAAPGRGRA